MVRSFDPDDLRLGRRWTMFAILLAGLLLGRTALPGWLSWCAATTSWIGEPWYLIGDRFDPTPSPPATEWTSAQGQKAINDYLAGAAPDSDAIFWPVAVIDHKVSEGLMRIAHRRAAIRPGQLVVCRSTFVGFVSEVDDETALVTTLQAPGMRLPVRILSEGEAEADAVVASILPRQSPSQLTLRRPSRIQALKVGLTVVTAERTILWDDQVGEVRVPEGLLVGRLANKTNASLGDRVPYWVEFREDGFSEKRVSIQLDGQGGVGRPSTWGQGFWVRDVECLRSPEWSGAGLDISTDGALLEVGQSVTLNGQWVGRIDRVGFRRCQGRRIRDGGFVLDAIGSGPTGTVLAPLQWLGEDRFRLLGEGPGLLHGDWLVTSPFDPLVPEGLLLGRVLEFGADRIGRVERVSPRRGDELSVWRVADRE